MENWVKAGKIAAESLNYGCELAKPGIKLLELAEKIEAKIKELGGKQAFPVNLSLNELAAHYTPASDDTTILKAEDLLKIDVGVHIEGHIGDCARTVGDDKELIRASEACLAAAIPLCVPGRKIREIGKAIAEAANEHGFISIRNLSGHGISHFDLHCGLSIPNFDNGDETVLKEGAIIAIEPFVTRGNSARVSEGKPSGIYKLEKVKPVRDMNARKILSFIANEYSSLPFASRWLEKEFPKAKFYIQLLIKEGILRSYPQLYESSKGNVSQAEHTIQVKENPVILTQA
ncbi:MAG: type II methionyl aminopeptidase [Candidatus Nanoarchaeia archaeon]|nr:type II methionyl aminopeptidase [Candidatus Nanoarchaeia archaeon]